VTDIGKQKRHFNTLLVLNNVVLVFVCVLLNTLLDYDCSNKLRRLIIDRLKPEFSNTLSKGNIEKVKSIFKTLNKPQRTAILKVYCKLDLQYHN